MARTRKTEKQKLIEKLVRDAIRRAVRANIARLLTTRQGGRRRNHKSKLYEPGG